MRRCEAPRCKRTLTGRPHQRTCSARCRVALSRWERNKPAGKTLRRARKAAQARASALERVTSIPPDLHVCAVDRLHEIVPSGSVDAIFTDPPYLGEFVRAGIYASLARFAVHALRPGGLLMTMLGDLFLPRCLADLTVDGLTFRFAVAVHYPQSRQDIHAARITLKHKTLPTYYRDGARPEGRYPYSFYTAAPFKRNEKGTHLWAQSEPTIREILSHWVQPQSGATVCDPFCGAGSTLVAARSLGHFVIGADVDPSCIAVTAEALKGAP